MKIIDTQHLVNERLKYVSDISFADYILSLLERQFRADHICLSPTLLEAVLLGGGGAIPPRRTML